MVNVGGSGERLPSLHGRRTGATPVERSAGWRASRDNWRCAGPPGGPQAPNVPPPNRQDDEGDDDDYGSPSGDSRRRGRSGRDGGVSPVLSRARSARSALTGMPVQSRKRRTNRSPRRVPQYRQEINHTTAQPVDDSESDEVGVQEQGVRALPPRLAGTSPAADTLLECTGADGAAARRRRE